MEIILQILDLIYTNLVNHINNNILDIFGMAQIANCKAYIIFIR